MIKLGRKAMILISSILALFFLVLYLVLKKTEQLILDSFEDKIIAVNQKEPYQISYKDIEISFFDRTFYLTDVLVVPDKLSRDNDKAQPHIAANRMVASRFEIFPLLFRKNLKVGKIELSDLEVVVQNKRNRTSPKSSTTKKDSKLQGIQVDQIELTDYRLIQLQPNLKDTIGSLTGEAISLTNLSLQRVSGNLLLDFKDISLQAYNQTIVFNQQRDTAKFKELSIHLDKGIARLKDLSLGNMEGQKKISLQNPYNTPVNALKVPLINCFGINRDSLILNKNLIIDSVILEKASIKILKNLNKPWNTDRVQPLPQQLLRRNKNHFWFKKIAFRNAKFTYKEIVDSKEVVVPIDSLNMVLNHLGTKQELYQDSLNRLEVEVSGKLFKEVHFSYHLTSPNPIISNFFQFNGSTSSFHFEAFNPVMVPTSNIKFDSGSVHQLNFSGYGNEQQAEGEFVMTFKDLKTVVLKQNTHKENKTFSWLANATVRKENPKNGKLKVAQMKYKRVPYKGFGNYMFKTVESGLINSVYPFGKRKEYTK
ncbi:MAG: hypothetical protein AAGC43_09565 [Bacteroidota bacterium]